MEDQSRSVTKGGGDPLAAMYFVAAVLMGLGAMAVVLFLFLPRDLFTRDNPNAWVPGTEPGYAQPETPTPRIETPAEAAVREELHQH